MYECPYCHSQLEFSDYDFIGNEYCPTCHRKLVTNFNTNKSFLIKNPKTCKICGRKLTSVDSVTHGMGPTCYRKYLKVLSNKNNLF